MTARTRFIAPSADQAHQSREAAEHHRKRNRHRRSPCGNPPSTPTGLTGSYDRAEGGKQNRIRASLRWTEVTTDTSGLSARVREYVLEMEYTANLADWYVHRRMKVPAKDDTDPNDKVHVVVKGIVAKLSYRYRVRARDTSGCESDWSAYHDLGSPGPEEPPAPSNVKVFESATDRIVVKLTESPDPDPARDDVHPDVVDHGAEISLLSSFETIYDRDRHFKGNRVSFRPDKADLRRIFYARAWSNDEDGTRSAKIPAWDPELHAGQGNSDPYALPDGVGIARGQREKIIWTIPGAAQVKTYPAPWTADRDYDVVKAKVTVSDHDPATHPADGAPSGGPFKLQLVRVRADLSTRDNMMSSDDRLRVEAGEHKDLQFVEDFQITEVLNQEQVVPKVIAANGATDVVIILIVDPKD